MILVTLFFSPISRAIASASSFVFCAAARSPWSSCTFAMLLNEVAT